MSESSLTLEALMSDLALQLEGHFVELTDRQRSPELLYLFARFAPLSTPVPPLPPFSSLPPSLSLHLPEYYRSAAFDPPPSHQSMQTAERRERGRRMARLPVLQVLSLPCQAEV